MLLREYKTIVHPAEPSATALSSSGRAFILEVQESTFMIVEQGLIR